MKEPPKGRPVLVWTRDWAGQTVVHMAEFMGSPDKGYWVGDYRFGSPIIFALPDIIGWSEIPDEPQHFRAALSAVADGADAAGVGS